MDVCFTSRLHYFGGEGYDQILKSFVPKLTAEGLSELQVHTMMFENPQRALAYDF